MKMKANFLYKPGNFQMDDCQIEKVVELTHDEFCKLKITPLENQSCIMENRNCMFSRDSIMHCLLALGQDSNDGILIEAEGYDYPRYAAYIPGMRDIINAEMDRAAEFIVRQGVENTGSGSWCVYFEELEEKLGLTIREGNGLDELLRDALYRRDEVIDVEMDNGCIDTNFYTDFCHALDEEAERAVYLPSWRKAKLYDHAVAAVLKSCEGKALYDMLHDSFGLTIQEIRDHQYLTDEELAEVQAIPRQVLEGGMRVRDLLQCYGSSPTAYLDCGDPHRMVSLKELAQWAADGQEDISALLDAQAADVRKECYGTSLVLDGDAAMELVRCHESMRLHRQTEQAAGPVMEGMQ